MKKLSTGLVPGSIRAGDGMSGSNALGLGARVGAPAGRDSEGLPDIAPPVSPTTAGCFLAWVRGERRFGVAAVGCWLCETTTGGGAVGGVAAVVVVSDASGVVEDGEEGEAEVEAGVDGGREGAAKEAELLLDVKPSSCLDTESACPDCVSVIVDAPLSGGRVAMVPAKTSARRKNLLTRVPSSSEISQVFGSWPLM